MKSPSSSPPISSPRISSPHVSTSRISPSRASESGQASLLLVLVLGLFLLPMLAFSVDLTSMWLHRQAAQTAADSACQAGAMDLLGQASGLPAPNASYTSFITGTANNCASLSGASLCSYANFNGYNGSGFNAKTASNSVSWTFPAAVAGVTTPSASEAPHPFLKVTVEENVKTWFMSLLGHKYQPVAATCTCGLVGTLQAPPMVVLDATDSATLSIGGGALISLMQGPQRSIQVNSSSSTAVECSGGGEFDLSQAGPNGTGGDLAIFGGPSANPTCWGSPYENLALNPGTTGSWQGSVLPMVDPYGGVPAPTAPPTSPTASKPEIVTYGQDGCPDHSPTNYVPTVPHSGCQMYEPGYYPSGLSLAGNNVDIFKPGLYYMNGSLSIGGSDEVRPATPCTPACSPYSTTTSQQTDGVMFYFAKGQLEISGGSGVLSSSRVDALKTTAMTCDGSSPPASLAIPSTINGNVLLAPCMASGTYSDSYGDTTDTVSSTGTRGLLIFQGHANQATGGTFTGSGALAFSGVMYFHDSSSSSPSTFSIDGGAGTTSYMIGNLIADKINLSGSGKINMVLSNAQNVSVLGVALLN